MARFVAQFLKDVSGDVEDRRASLRVQTNEIVQIRSDSGRRFSITMLDASETGCRLTAIEGATPGDKVMIEFPDGTKADATIVWSSGKEMGIHFRRPQPHLKWLAAAA
jgi:hypothetical protein